MTMMMMKNYFCGMIERQKKCLALFTAGTIIRDPHHCKFLIRCKQDLNLHRSSVKFFLNEVEQ